jgi:hypothetical protein
MCAAAQTCFNQVCIFKTQAKGFNWEDMQVTHSFKSKSKNPVKGRKNGSVVKACLNN